MASSTRPRTAALSEPPAPGTAIYDSLAPVYDLLTAGYEHGRWLGALERLALEHGLAGRRLLTLEAPGGIVEVVVEVFERVEGELWRHSCARQPHRHYPLAQIGELVDRAGLRAAAAAERPLAPQAPGGEPAGWDSVSSSPARIRAAMSLDSAR